jgi:hypothetical protein
MTQCTNSKNFSQYSAHQFDFRANACFSGVIAIKPYPRSVRGNMIYRYANLGHLVKPVEPALQSGL